jgi:hypothetical protein
MSKEFKWDTLFRYIKKHANEIVDGSSNGDFDGLQQFRLPEELKDFDALKDALKAVLFNGTIVPLNKGGVNTIYTFNEFPKLILKISIIKAGESVYNKKTVLVNNCRKVYTELSKYAELFPYVAVPYAMTGPKGANFKIDGKLYNVVFTLEPRIEGVEFEHALRSRMLTLDDVLRTLHIITDTLTKFKSIGFNHNDFHTRNVMIRKAEDGVYPVVIDFDWATFAGQDHEDVKAEALKGTNYSINRQDKSWGDVRLAYFYKHTPIAGWNESIDVAHLLESIKPHARGTIIEEIVNNSRLEGHRLDNLVAILAAMEPKKGKRLSPGKSGGGGQRNPRQAAGGRKAQPKKPKKVAKELTKSI